MHDARLSRHSLPYVAPLEPHTGLKTSLQKRGQSVPDQMRNRVKLVSGSKDQKPLIAFTDNNIQYTVKLVGRLRQISICH